MSEPTHDAKCPLTRGEKIFAVAWVIAVPTIIGVSLTAISTQADRADACLAKRMELDQASGQCVVPKKRREAKLGGLLAD